MSDMGPCQGHVGVVCLHDVINPSIRTVCRAGENNSATAGTSHPTGCEQAEAVFTRLRRAASAASSTSCQSLGGEHRRAGTGALAL